jgi:hypothetical protein
MRGPLQVKGRLNAEDLVEALREAHRVAKPGPRLAHDRRRSGDSSRTPAWLLIARVTGFARM